MVWRNRKVFTLLFGNNVLESLRCNWYLWTGQNNQTHSTLWVWGMTYSVSLSFILWHYLIVSASELIYVTHCEMCRLNNCSALKKTSISMQESLCMKLHLVHLGRLEVDGDSHFHDHFLCWHRLIFLRQILTITVYLNFSSIYEKLNVRFI